MRYDDSIVDVYEDISKYYEFAYTVKFENGEQKSYFIDNGKPRLICMRKSKS